MEMSYYMAPQTYTVWKAIEGSCMELPYVDVPFSYPVWNAVEGAYVAEPNLVTCEMHPVWSASRGSYTTSPNVEAYYATYGLSCPILSSLAIPTVLLTLAKFKKSRTHPSAYRRKFRKICEEFSSSVQIYTDGTEKEGRSAAAAISSGGESRTRKLPDGSTSNDAGLSALLLALNIVECSFSLTVYLDCRFWQAEKCIIH